MPVYSHSRIGTYETCPLQYRYRYLDRRTPDIPDTVEAFMGSRVHETLEKLYRDLMYSKLNTVEELTAYYSDIWQKGWTDDIVINRDEYTADNYRLTGEKAVRKYYERFEPFETRTVGIEMRLTVTLDSGHKVQGYIDRLDQNEEGIYEVHDYKTGAHLPAQEDIDRDRQLALYSIMVRDRYPDCRDVRLIWHYLAFDRDLETRKTEAELENLKQSLQDQIRAIEQAVEFPPRRSGLCRWCGYRRICPEWKDLFKDETEEAAPLFTDVDGTELADRYAELSEKKKEITAELSELKKKAIEYARAQDITRIFGTSHELAVHTGAGITLPGKSSDERTALVQALKHIGRYDEVAETDINLPALKTIIREKKWPKHDLAELEKFIRRTETVRVHISERNV